MNKYRCILPERFPAGTKPEKTNWTVVWAAAPKEAVELTRHAFVPSIPSIEPVDVYLACEDGAVENPDSFGIRVGRFATHPSEVIPFIDDERVVSRVCELMGAGEPETEIVSILYLEGYRTARNRRYSMADVVRFQRRILEARNPTADKPAPVEKYVYLTTDEKTAVWYARSVVSGKPISGAMTPEIALARAKAKGWTQQPTPSQDIPTQGCRTCEVGLRVISWTWPRS